MQFKDLIKRKCPSYLNLVAEYAEDGAIDLVFVATSPYYWMNNSFINDYYQKLKPLLKKYKYSLTDKYDKYNLEYLDFTVEDTLDDKIPMAITLSQATCPFPNGDGASILHISLYYDIS